MSFVTRGTCPHKRGVFVWLADGPRRGDQSDPNWGRYPWVHDTSTGPGHLQVCDLMLFALPVDCGEMCACGHSSDMHKAATGPLPAGMIAKQRACSCACPDFRHRREDIEKRRGPETAWVELAKAPAAPAPAPKVRRAITETVQGSLFDEALA